MRWTAQRALTDQRVPDRCRCANLAPKHFGDIPRLVRLWAEVGHRAKVAVLAGREAIETDTEEAVIELDERFDAGLADVCQRDRRSIGVIPAVLASFLQEIGITERLGGDLGDGF